MFPRCKNSVLQQLCSRALRRQAGCYWNRAYALQVLVTALSVPSLCLCGVLFSSLTNHRDTENTEVAQRKHYSFERRNACNSAWVGCPDVPPMLMADKAPQALPNRKHDGSGCFIR